MTDEGNPSDTYCPFCQSTHVLPFEEEKDYRHQYPMHIIFISALLVIGGYLIFMASVYISFPLVVLISIIVTTRMINKREREKKRELLKSLDKDYLCLNCDKPFNLERDYH